ncbi:MAG: D-alanyl-D-alanine carboxypeptidase/D-alanyl-D-alanine-endopeptidase [Duodenibacillus sp.]
MAFFSSLAACAAVASPLPGELQEALAKSGFPASSVALHIAPLDETGPATTLNASVPMKPASVIKVVTTAAALDIFKPNHAWHTDVTARTKPDAKGVVRGVTLVGGGDPHLMVERLWLVAERLRAAGVRRIEGSIRVDRSLFDVPADNPGDFDGAPTRIYNVGPDAMMVNLKAVSVTITPEKGTQWATVSAFPPLDGVRFPTKIRTKPGRCGDWRRSIDPRLSDASRIRFQGRFPASCGPQIWHASLWTPDEYLTRLLRYVFKRSGIVWQGRAVGGSARTDDVLLWREYSEPLSLVVTWINKYSNNPMARMLFLRLARALPDAATEDGKPPPATLEASRSVLNNWLVARVGTAPGSVYVDNGSGLSRRTHATAESLAQVLAYMYRQGVMPEFMASLPMTGVDGTMRKRPLGVGSAHVKTGYLQDVRSLAGYVTDVDGRRWSVVMLINDAAPADRDRAFARRVLEWVASGRARAGQRQGDS